MKKSFLSLMLVISSASVPALAGTTITGLDKEVLHYGETAMDITLDDLCPQDGRLYKALSASQISDAQIQLQASLDYMSEVKDNFSDTDNAGSFGSAGKIERWYPQNSQCLNTDKFLSAVHSKITETQGAYFSDELSDRALNVVSLGFRKKAGVNKMLYYSSLGERVAKTELEIISKIKELGNQPEKLQRSLLTVDTGDCAGKSVVVTGTNSNVGNKFELVQSLFSTQASRVSHGGHGDLTNSLTYATFIEWNHPGDIACAQKLRKVLIAELVISDDGKVFPVRQTMMSNRRNIRAQFGSVVRVNFGQ